MMLMDGVGEGVSKGRPRGFRKVSDVVHVPEDGRGSREIGVCGARGSQVLSQPSRHAKCTSDKGFYQRRSGKKILAGPLSPVARKEDVGEH